MGNLPGAQGRARLHASPMLCCCLHPMRRHWLRAHEVRRQQAPLQKQASYHERAHGTEPTLNKGTTRLAHAVFVYCLLVRKQMVRRHQLRSTATATGNKPGRACCSLRKRTTPPKHHHKTGYARAGAGTCCSSTTARPSCLSDRA